MPRRRRTPKKRVRELTEEQFWELMLDCRPPDGGSAFGTEAEAREAWLEHRDKLLASCLEENRPGAWWRFESPRKRKLFVPERDQLKQMGLI